MGPSEVQAPYGPPAPQGDGGTGGAVLLSPRYRQRSVAQGGSEQEVA